jgi:ferrochelatase
VLFNLGGPDSPAAVRPFLENLFSDPAIIAAPALIRLPLAALIARTRADSARANYAVMGGASPILQETEAQAEALLLALSRALPDREVRVFIAMRYWRPFTQDAAEAVADFGPDDVVLAPLYPQFSTTTTGSSLTAWAKAYRGAGEVHTLCCWYENAAFVETHADGIRRTWEAAGKPEVRLLFSAHGLPERISEAGDPYRWQIEASCATIAGRLGEGWDWTVCYQSRVGPLKWIGPSTPEAIAAAVADGKGVLIAPVSFVSDHIETLVELDRDYAELAARLGASAYLRSPVPGVDEVFISGLADAVASAASRLGVCPDGGACPANQSRCARRS